MHRRATRRVEKMIDDDVIDLKLEYDLAIRVEFLELEKVMKLMPKLDELLQKHNISTKLEKLDENLFWITLRPSDDHKHRFSEFMLFTKQKYLDRQMFLSKTWVWEQKGEDMDNLGKGYHIHILATLTKTTNKGHLLRNTKSTFSKFLGGDVPDAFVEIKKVDNQIYKNNLLHYISGVKVSTEEVNKERAVEMDAHFRARYNLEDFYTDDATIQDQLSGINEKC